MVTYLTAHLRRVAEQQRQREVISPPQPLDPPTDSSGSRPPSDNLKTPIAPPPSTN